MKTPLIEFRNVTKRFNNQTVLDQVNLEIYEGEVTTIIGKSGTGKSVLLKHIIGLLTPDEGTILFRGQPLQNMSRSERDRYFSQISYMFQNNALFDSMTVFENIALPLRQTTHLQSEGHRREGEGQNGTDGTDRGGREISVRALRRHAETGGLESGPRDRPQDRSF